MNGSARLDGGVEGTLRNGLYIKSLPSSYSPPQLARYLARICFSSEKQCDEEKMIADGHFPSNLENLERLMRLHLLTFPFENTFMHYTEDHIGDVDPQKLYQRLMDEKKGSYCLGQNSLFLHILRGLGYRAYNVAGRVNIKSVPDPTEYSVPVHLVILVQPIQDSSITYLVDIGFGLGPVRPILLSDSEDNIVIGTTETETFRIRRGANPNSSLECDNPSKPSGQWILQVQRGNDSWNGNNKEEGEGSSTSTTPLWTPLFAFSEEEFYQNEITYTSIAISQGYYLDGALFRHNVIVTKCCLVDENGDLILDDDKMAKELEKIGKDVLKRDLGRAVLMGQELKYTYGKRSQVVKVLQTERERIKVLKDVFGISIEDGGMVHIKGLPSALEMKPARNSGLGVLHYLARFSMVKYIN